MNKRDTILDAREQLKMARENLALGKDSLAIGNLYRATHMIAKFSGALRKERAPTVVKTPPPVRGVVVTPFVRRQLGKTRRMP